MAIRRAMGPVSALLLGLAVLGAWSTAGAQEDQSATPPAAVAPAALTPPDQGPAVAGRSTGLPVPRFVSLGADRVNLRFGPGKEYPISWVLAREGLPVEIIGEFDTWRKVRLHDGDEGWVHSSLLSSRRTIMTRIATAASHHGASTRQPAPSAAQGAPAPSVVQTHARI
jgi:SH3-like domain-containing protein